MDVSICCACEYSSIYYLVRPIFFPQIILPCEDPLLLMGTVRSNTIFGLGVRVRVHIVCAVVVIYLTLSVKIKLPFDPIVRLLLLLLKAV